MTRKDVVDKIAKRMNELVHICSTAGPNVLSKYWLQNERKLMNKLLKDFASGCYEDGFRDAEWECEGVCDVCGKDIK